MQDTSIMRVPTPFKLTIKDIARRRGMSICEYLRNSGVDLHRNSDQLYRFINGIRVKKQ